MKIPRAQQNKYGCRFCAGVKGSNEKIFECDHAVCPYAEELEQYKNYERYEADQQKHFIHFISEYKEPKVVVAAKKIRIVYN